jgi:hypothetical protein
MKATVLWGGIAVLALVHGPGPARAGEAPAHAIVGGKDLQPRGVPMPGAALPVPLKIRRLLAHEDSDPDASRKVVPTDIYGNPLTGVGLSNSVGRGKH